MDYYLITLMSIGALSNFIGIVWLIKQSIDNRTKKCIPNIIILFILFILFLILITLLICFNKGILV